MIAAMSSGSPSARRLALAAGPVLTAAAWWALPAPAMHVPAVARALRIPLRSRLDGAVSLTFDDGPHPEGTPAVLDALAAANARATFFLVGEQVLRAPALAAEIAAAGHVVAVHGHRHRNLLSLAPRAVRDDLDRAAGAIHEATAAAPAPLHRAPYGVYSSSALAAVRARGWTPLLWSRWGRDWGGRATASSVAAEATGNLRAGDVILLHDADHYSVPGSWRATARALPRILEGIAAAGLRVTAVGGPADLYGR
jgi:peptidoglycan/xylan/chitin deacetylase (PgdA/CDA1 family)